MQAWLHTEIQKQSNKKDIKIYYKDISKIITFQFNPQKYYPIIYFDKFSYLGTDE